jgi:putative transposase
MKRKDVEETVQQDLETRVREGVKALFEQILEEEMVQHVGAERHQRSATRRGQRNGEYERDLVTGVGTIHQLTVPRDREGTFQTELFERYRRLTGSVEEAVLEMYLQGVSTRKVAAVTEALSGKRVGKDAVSRITARLEEQVQAWRERPLMEEYPYLYLDATYLKANWGGRVVSDDHEAIKAAVAAELAGVAWQRCVVHFERNVLAQVPYHAKAEVAADLRAIFAVRRRETAETLAEQFVSRWGKDFPQAAAVFQSGITEALTYLEFPSGHHLRIRTTNGLERLFQEIKRRTRVVGVFPNERSLVVLTTTVGLRVTEEWALRRYLDMELLEAQKQIQSGAPQITQLSRH